MKKDTERKDYLKRSSAEVAKTRLIEILSELEELGYKRESKSLGKIIGELEAWQNR